ncbi:MAG TPA: hypothetical protein VFA58_07300, partial [Chthoniobacterales bacterium]|nr:hypothetical protein [Chthoniobacterales bacterium]
MYRFLGLLLLALFAASLNFAQVAPVAKQAPTASPADEDADTEDEVVTPAPVQPQQRQAPVAQASPLGPNTNQ